MVAPDGAIFFMGSNDHYREEGPVRQVSDQPFEIGATEVTHAEFADFVAATGYVSRAERGLDAAQYPDWPEELLVPGHPRKAEHSQAGPSAGLAARFSNPATGPRRVVKGGSWLCAPGYCMRYRPSARQPMERDLGSNHTGFRIVRAVEPES